MSKSKYEDELVTYNGQTMSLREWANVSGVPLKTIVIRLQRGWSFDSALSMQESLGTFKGNEYSKWCLLNEPCYSGSRRGCIRCGFYKAEFERRKKLPLRVDPETGLRCKFIHDEVEG